MMFTKLSAAAIVALAASAAAEPTCPETLEMMHKIDDAKTLYYAVVPSDPIDANNGILCARLEAAAEAWLGFGISTDGNMIGSEAIMGNPDSPPSKCNLVSKTSIPACVPMDAAKQTLKDVKFEQADGMSMMSFTKLLVEDGEIPINAMGENTFLHAHGSSNEWGYHAGRGSYTLDLSPVPELYDAGATTTAATAAGPGATTAATTAAEDGTTAATTVAEDATTDPTTAAAEPATTVPPEGTSGGSMSVRAVAVAASMIVPSLASVFLA